MRIVFFIFLLLPTAHAGNAECRKISEALRTLGASRGDPEARAQVGTCLVRAHIDQPAVARAVLGILRNQGEDILLREDLIEAFAESPLRRKVRIEGQLSPSLGPQEKENMNRAVGSVGEILAAAEAVKGMDELIPVTHLETDYFRALSDIVSDDANPVLLRATAVRALERLSVRVVESGIYDEKSLRLARETLRTVASREDNASYFTDAGQAYSRLASAGLPGYAREAGVANRMLSSVKSPSER